MDIDCHYVPFLALSTGLVIERLVRQIERAAFTSELRQRSRAKERNVAPVNRSAAEKDSVYEAVRYAWKLDPRKAAKAEIVLAVLQGLIIGAFVAGQWLPATPAN